MTVACEDVGRCDVLLHRRSDEKVGVLWRENVEGAYRAKDLSRWTASFQMLLDDGTGVYAQACVCTSDGYAIAYIPYTAFMSDEWNARTFGEWRIDGTGPDGEHRLLAWGYWRLS